jgi:hypothetical protein
MRKLAVALAALALMLGSLALMANAQAQQIGATSLHARPHNATIFHETACRGWDRLCPLGWHRACAPYRCWCAPG